MQHIEVTPTYLHCPRCRLAVRSATADPTRPECPRCLERSGVSSRMYASPLDGAEMRLRLEKVRPLHAVRHVTERFSQRIPGSRPVRSRPVAG